MPTFDLVIPVYNKANHITRCLESAINQKFKFSNIILVNDGSTDHLEDVLIKYKKITNLKIVNQSNKGVSNARNTGIRETKSDFVTLLDADDELHEMYLYEIVRLYNKYYFQKPEILSCRHQNINTEVLLKKQIYKGLNSTLNYSNYPLLLYSFYKTILCASGVTLAKELIHKISFPENIKIGEDIYIWEKILINKKLFFSEQILVNVYKNAENRSKSFNNRYDPPYYLTNYKQLLSDIQIKKNILKILCFYFFHYSSLIIEYSRYLINNTENGQLIVNAQSFYVKKLLKFYKLFIFNYIKKYFYLRETISELKIIKPLSYSLITPSAPIVFVIMYIKNLDYLASQYAILSSGVMILTQILSFYSRTYIYNNISRFSFYHYYFLRFLFLNLILISMYVFFFIFMKKYFYIGAISINVVLTFWLLDYFFLFYEKYYSKKGFWLLGFLTISYYIILMIFGKNEFNYFVISSLFFGIIYILFVANVLSFKSIKYFQIKKVLSGKISKYFFVTNLFLVISNFFVRIIFEQNLNSELLATIFLILSLSTFPSTLYAQSMGQYVKNTKTAKIVLYFFYILIFVTFLLMSFFLIDRQFALTSVNIIFVTALYSFGSFFLLMGTVYKSILIANNSLSQLFKKEITFYTINILLASLLFIHQNLFYLYMLFSGGTLFLLLNKLQANDS